jgi:restriction endonuclease S subunit
MSEDATLDESVVNDKEQPDLQNTPSGKYNSDWPIVRSGEQFTLQNGKFLKSDERSDDGEYPVYGGNGIMGYTSDANVSQGKIVIGRVGAYCGNIHKTDSEAWVTDNSIILTNDSQDFSNEYLRYLLTSVNLGQFSEQSAQPRISQSTVANLRIPKPPLPEQRKIAFVLHTVDRAIEKTEEVITRLNRLFTGMRRTLLREGINSDTTIQSTPTGRYPSNWELVRAGNFLELRNGEYLAKKARTEDGDYPVYGGNGIMGHTEKSIVGPETVVIGRVGAYCGNVHLTEEDAWVTDNAIIISELSNDYLPQFIVHLLDEIGLGQYSEQSAQPRISQSTVENLRIPKPSIDEQQEIVDKLSSIPNAKNAEETYKNQLKRVKRGLMQDLLSGKVITTDTNIRVPEEIRQHG